MSQPPLLPPVPDWVASTPAWVPPGTPAAWAQPGAAWTPAPRTRSGAACPWLAAGCRGDRGTRRRWGGRSPARPRAARRRPRHRPRHRRRHGRGVRGRPGLVVGLGRRFVRRMGVDRLPAAGPRRRRRAGGTGSRPPIRCSMRTRSAASRATTRPATTCTTSRRRCRHTSSTPRPAPAGSRRSPCPPAPIWTERRAGARRARGGGGRRCGPIASAGPHYRTAEESLP